MVKTFKKGQEGYLSILKNTNEAYSIGGYSFSNIKNGSLIQLNGQPTFCNVVSSKPMDLHFKFEKIENDKILVRGNTGAQITVGDFILVSIRTYEVFGLSGILSKGKGYVIGDVLEIRSGDPKRNVQTNKLHNASFEVKEIDDSGGIKKIRVLDRGIYFKAPQEDCVLEGGAGAEAIISVDFEEQSERLTIDRQVKSLERSVSLTKIQLDIPIASIVKSAEFKINKWKMVLSSNYVGEEDAFCFGYLIIGDFTANMGYPLIPANATSPSAIYNETLIKMDKEIHDLREQIDWLKSKV